MEAFLFDLDGLLVDSEPLHFEAFTNICKSFNYPIQWDFESYCQKAHTQSLGLKKAFLELYPEAIALWPELYHAVKLHFAQLIGERPLPLLPGVIPFIELLLAQGKKLAVVTNSSTPMAVAIITKEPFLKKIPLWITREDYKNPKPAPDGYLKALQILQIEPARACGFEDSPRGLEALKAAKVKAFHIHRTPFGHPLYFSSFMDLLKSMAIL